MKKYLIFIGLILLVGVVVFLSYVNPWSLSNKDEELDGEDMSYEELGINEDDPLLLDIREQTDTDFQAEKRQEVARYLHDNPDLDDLTQKKLYNDIFWSQTGITHGDINDAAVIGNVVTNEVNVIVYFTDEGYKKLEQVSERNIGKNIGIFLDEVLISSPVVKEVTKKDDTLITGVSSEEEARLLIGQIRKSVEKNNK